MSNHPQRHLVRRVGAVASCLALVLAGCGSDDDDAAAGSEDAESVADSSTEETPTSEAPPDTGATTIADTAPETTPDTTPDTTAAASATTEAPPTTAMEVTSEPASSDGDSATAAAPGDDPPVCTPYFEVSAAFAGEPDPATIGQLLDEVEGAAPDQIADALATLTGGARTVLETGDFTVFEAPEFGEAVASADGWMTDNCEFVTRTELVATEYAYSGNEDEYPAGRTAFTLVNGGAEAHELAIIRKNDGVDATLEELMELPESEAETMTTFVGATFVGSPGETGDLIVDLEPGSYIAVCNIAAGTMVMEDGSFVEGTGEPHVMLGMSFEFSVT